MKAVSKKRVRTFFINLQTLFEIIKDIIALITFAKYIYSFLKYAKAHLQTLNNLLYSIDWAIRNSRIVDLFLDLEKGFSLKDKGEVERIVTILGFIKYNVRKKEDVAELILQTENKVIKRVSMTRFRSLPTRPIRYIFNFLDNWSPNYPLPIENFFGVDED